jgi:hypothetical protein
MPVQQGIPAAVVVLVVHCVPEGAQPQIPVPFPFGAQIIPPQQLFTPPKSQ